jgi:hypothetical protein
MQVQLNMIIVIYITCAALFSIFAAYASAFQGATLYWGRILAGIEPNSMNITDPEVKATLMKESIMNRGLQDGLTTRAHKRRLNIQIIMNISLLAIGFYLFTWYVPIITLIGVFISKIILRSFIPSSESDFYKNKLLKELESQEEYYISKEEDTKAEATKYFIDLLNSKEYLNA